MKDIGNISYKLKTCCLITTTNIAQKTYASLLIHSVSYKHVSWTNSIRCWGYIANGTSYLCERKHCILAKENVSYLYERYRYAMFTAHFACNYTAWKSNFNLRGMYTKIAAQTLKSNHTEWYNFEVMLGTETCELGNVFLLGDSRFDQILYAVEIYCYIWLLFRCISAFPNGYRPTRRHRDIGWNLLPRNSLVASLHSQLG